MSKVHSVPRKQGRRPAGTDFVHFGVESLFARELRACMNGIILSFFKTGKIKDDSKDDMHNSLETRS